VNLSATLARLNACSKAREWCAGKTLKQAWRTCERPEWLLWLAAHAVPRQVLCSVTADLVECVALPYAADPRPAGALRVLRAWCRGEASDAEVRAAADGAAAARHTAYSAAATHAADAAAYSADAAAYSSAYAAAAADAAADAADAADAAAEVTDAEMCAVIRAIISAEEIVAGLREVSP